MTTTNPAALSEEAVEKMARTHDDVMGVNRALGSITDRLKAARAAWDASPGPGLAENSQGGWLPIVLCPTDGVWRAVKLPDGSETVASFEGEGLGPQTRRWRTKVFGHHNPSHPTGRAIGGVEQHTAPFDTFLISNLPEGVYPTHFRPNDTVYGKGEARIALARLGEERIEDGPDC